MESTSNFLSMKDLVSKYKKDGFVFEKKIDKCEARSQRNDLMKQIHDIYLGTRKFKIGYGVRTG